MIVVHLVLRLAGHNGGILERMPSTVHFLVIAPLTIVPSTSIKRTKLEVLFAMHGGCVNKFAPFCPILLGGLFF